MRAERRYFPRIEVSLPAKVRVGTRHMASLAADLSAAGVRVEMDASAPVRPGVGVRVFLARDPRQALLPAADGLEGTVVRSERVGTRQVVAVRFSEPRALALAA